MRSSIPPIKSDDKELITKDLQTAEHSNEVFTKVFINDSDAEDNISEPIFDCESSSKLQSKSGSRLETIIISESEIEHVIKHIHLKTSKTPENIPAFVIG